MTLASILTMIRQNASALAWAYRGHGNPAILSDTIVISAGELAGSIPWLPENPVVATTR
jgi:hypothetical protein